MFMAYANYGTFKQYRNEIENILHRMLSTNHPGDLDEQGVPAYLEGFYWSREIFWKRIQVSTQSILEKHGGKCIDFGCGSGILLPFLDPIFEIVYAVDIAPKFAQDFINFWTDSVQHPLKNIYLFNKLEYNDLTHNSIDLILALDSLEHVDNIKDVLLKMKDLLKPGGSILISGPTENLFYRIGRKIVGFSGHYHRRSIYDIEKEINKYFKIKSVHKIGFPFTLFLLIDAEKR
jgi:2-polyprenyl-3-methyl-5-hydroxy-6-metoxy-1,4-benzoquinol methylase